MPEVPTGQPGVTSCIPACNKRSDVRPEGNVVGTLGCVLVFEDSSNKEIYYKESDDGLVTGWQLVIKLL